MKQPYLGLISTSLVIALSFLIIGNSEHNFFMGWLSFAIMACIPTQIVCAFLWGPTLSERYTPLNKALLQTLISLIGGIICGSALHVIAGAQHGPTPYLMMLTIVSVISTFWIMVVWNTWPFSKLTKSPLTLGLTIIMAAYGLAYVLFSLASNYAFLINTEIYISDLDPQGWFPAWHSLSFLVTSVAIIMMCMLLDFFPISKWSFNASVGAVINSFWVLILSALVFYTAVYILLIDPVIYMVRGPVSFVFGAFIVLNMFENSFFSRFHQPIKGLLLTCVAIVLALLMQLLYQFYAQFLQAGIQSGPGQYQLELWLANAMLAVTFPLIVMFSDFFALWPFRPLEATDKTISTNTAELEP